MDHPGGAPTPFSVVTWTASAIPSSSVSAKLAPFPRPMETTLSASEVVVDPAAKVCGPVVAPSLRNQTLVLAFANSM